MGDEQQILNILIRTIDGKLRGTMTEPDLVVITSSEVVFIECKLNQNGNASPWKAQGNGADKRMAKYKEESELSELNLNEINNEYWRGVYQLIRQYIYCKLLSKKLKKEPKVVPLINEKHRKKLLVHYDHIKLNKIFGNINAFKDFVTWQDIKNRISVYNLENKRKILDKLEKALENSK